MWYWHFVDVVWLFVLMWVYIWDGTVPWIITRENVRYGPNEFDFISYHAQPIVFFKYWFKYYTEYLTSFVFQG